MSPRLITHADLAGHGIAYSKSQIWRMERAGKFPKRVPVGLSRYAYVESEIDRYVADLIAARDAGATIAPVCISAAGAA